MLEQFLTRQFLLVVVIVLLTWITTRLLVAFLERRKSFLAPSFALLGNVVTPLIALLVILDSIVHIPHDSATWKTLQTAVGIAVIWLLVGALSALFFISSAALSWREKTPRLLVDIVRVSILGIGASFVIASVWNKDFTPILTTFGIGSIVIGLALQDTLGNLFAGLAIVFERPFYVGDWLEFNNTIGKVQLMNWRSVHLVTRDFDEVIVANSVLTKERMTNFSRPTKVHGVRIHLGFSFDLQPNQVKTALTRAAVETTGVVSVPAPDVRVMEYEAYRIQYEVLFFIADYEQLPRIRNEFMTKVWYVHKRSGLPIPYPIQTVLHQPVQPSSLAPAANPLVMIRNSELLSKLSDEECSNLLARASLLTFGVGEVIVVEGDVGTTLFFILEGRARVSKRTEIGAQQVGELKAGDFFGEMSMLTGDPRAATVSALEDSRVLMITHEVFREILSQRPDVVSHLGHLAHSRKRALAELAETISSQPRSEVRDDESDDAIIQRIRRFFRL